MLSTLFARRRAIREQAERFVSSVLEGSPATKKTRAARTEGRSPFRGKALRRAIEETSHFAMNRSLGIVGKAMLANDVKWALRQQGVDAAFVEATTQALVLSFGRRS
jgi:hypothetical protein